METPSEDKLAEDPGKFAGAGLNLLFVGRQLVCLNGGRADVLFKAKQTKRYVVVELKRGLVGRNAVAQALSYRASVGTQFRVGSALPNGVLVGDRLDNEAAGMIDDDPRLQFISLSQLGF